MIARLIRDADAGLASPASFSIRPSFPASSLPGVASEIKSGGPRPSHRRPDAPLDGLPRDSSPAMVEDRFIELIEPVLREMGSVREAGESFREPPLDVLGYYPRRVRLGRVPLLGRALGVVMVVRQPVDVEGTRAGYQRLLDPHGHGRQRPVPALAGTGPRPDRRGPHPRADRAGRRRHAPRRCST